MNNSEPSTAEKEKAYQAAYREKNKKRIAGQKAEYQEKNKEHIAARGAEYYKKNKERLCAKQARYRQTHKEAMTVWQKNNKEHNAAIKAAWYKKNKESVAAYRVRILRTLRVQFYDMYGLKKEGHEHGVCPCCGEDLMAFGTISHIDGKGAEHRRTARNYKMLVDALAIKDTSRFAAECFNCNLAAARNGGICPHKENPRGVLS